MFRPLVRWVFFCLCLELLAWGQAANPTPGAPGVPLRSAPEGVPAAKPLANKPPDTSVVPLNTAVITIDGLCDTPPAEKSASANCKTVITRAEFEKIINTIQPDLPLAQQRQLADNYARVLMMSHEAHRLGLDRGAEYEERIRLAELQVRAQLVLKHVRDEATEVSDKDVADYYQAHLAQYDQASAEQLFIPLMKETSAKTREAEGAKTPAESAAEMRKEAEALRARAASGEDFVKLQAEASHFAGLKTPPDVHISNLRRGSLSRARAVVMDLKVGEVSQVIADPTGFFVYKMMKKEAMPLDQVRSEIVNQLKSQRMQEAMQGLQRLGKPTLEEKYFGAASGPPPRAFPPRGPASPAAAKAPVPAAPKAAASQPMTPTSNSTPSSGPK